MPQLKFTLLVEVVKPGKAVIGPVTVCRYGEQEVMKPCPKRAQIS